ncbi:capsular polysaccharide biosynthesis protein CapF [Alkalibacillus haloalkaliphilus]|uniref:capsular polysaccharide biosynthesis protein CapF n=1 Tax=Alkalibacillus haloalkaliphilus TaxID=94136 RepID=UPI0002F8AF10|nr:capsular polysaccharide biosynthesis protein CapF [Alkalibacillus haloalkaliphilus]
MGILVTGANGFIGQNLIAELNVRGFEEVYEVTRETTEDQLQSYCSKARFVFHLAGVNRPQDPSEFMKGNYEFTKKMLTMLSNSGNKCPILLTSSIQAEHNNPYGESKRAGEQLVFDYGQANGVNVFVYRLPNVFGKWSKPNYNSAVATFCHNISRDLPIQIGDPDVNLNLVYIDDVIKEFISDLEGETEPNGNFSEVKVTHEIRLGELVDKLYSFKEIRSNLSVPDLSDPLTKKLYSTYLSFLPEDQFSYELKMNQDNRGSFTEVLRTVDRGQVSVNVSKPGITKGNHWHHTKNEKFLVVSGEGVIRFRKPGEDEVIEYFVSGNKLEVVDIPVGYTHNIENLGSTDMVTLMWVNEPFDPSKPDTHFLEV